MKEQQLDDIIAVAKETKTFEAFCKLLKIKYNIDWNKHEYTLDDAFIAGIWHGVHSDSRKKKDG